MTRDLSRVNKIQKACCLSPNELDNFAQASFSTVSYKTVTVPGQGIVSSFLIYF